MGPTADISLASESPRASQCYCSGLGEGATVPKLSVRSVVRAAIVAVQHVACNGPSRPHARCLPTSDGWRLTAIVRFGSKAASKAVQSPFVKKAFVMIVYLQQAIRWSKHMYLVHAFEEAQPAEQRRRFPRFEVQCRAKIRIGKRYYAGYIHNISEAGAKLRTISSIRKIGAVTLQLPDLPPVQCRLCWTNAYHAGVLFNRPLTKNELQRWMARRKAFKQLNPGLEPYCELIELTGGPAGDIAVVSHTHDISAP